MPANKPVTVGEVVKPHGVRGELCIDSHADSPSLFLQAGRVRLDPPPGAPGHGRDYPVRGARPHQGRMLLTLEGVTGRDQAEALRGYTVSVREGDLPPPEPDEIYLHELIGLRIRLAGAAPEAPDVGVLADIQDAGGAELWVIRAEDGHEILFPAAAELVPEVDLEAGVAVIDPPPGLLELYQEEGKE